MRDRHAAHICLLSHSYNVVMIVDHFRFIAGHWLHSFKVQINKYSCMWTKVGNQYLVNDFKFPASPIAQFNTWARYVNLRVAQATGMPGTFSPPPRVGDPDMHHGTYITHVPWCMPGSLTSCFLWSWWREKRSRHSRRMRNPQFYVSGKRPMKQYAFNPIIRQCATYQEKYALDGPLGFILCTR